MRPGSARPHDGDLDHQVVIAARLEARQHRHLRPALDLEHADRVRPCTASRRPRRRRSACRARALRRSAADHLEALAQGRQHAERQHVDLVDLSASRSSLSHSMTVRSSIAAFWIGTSSSSRPLRQHEAADMLRQVPRKADQLRRSSRPARAADRSGPGRPRRRASDRCRCRRCPTPAAIRPRCRATGRAPCPRRGWRCGCDRRSPWRPARRAPALSVDPLDDVLAPLVLEIDVDVGRLVAARSTGSARTASFLPGRPR